MNNTKLNVLVEKWRGDYDDFAIAGVYKDFKKAAKCMVELANDQDDFKDSMENEIDYIIDEDAGHADSDSDGRCDYYTNIDVIPTFVRGTKYDIEDGQRFVYVVTDWYSYDYCLSVYLCKDLDTAKQKLREIVDQEDNFWDEDRDGNRTFNEYARISDDGMSAYSDYDGYRDWEYQEYVKIEKLPIIM